MPNQDAITLALTDNDDPEPAATADRLSPRERQVSRLIAQGLTNRQISRALSISEKRTRIAVWAVQHGLRPSGPD